MSLLLSIQIFDFEFNRNWLDKKNNYKILKDDLMKSIKTYMLAKNIYKELK